MIRISASQVTKYLRCPRIFSWEYVERIKPPSRPRQDFGKEVHAILAAWLKTGTPPPKTPAGEVAMQGIKVGVLPMPSERHEVEETHFLTWSFGVLAKVIPDWSPSVADVLPDDEVLILDHKTTSDLRWAKTEDQLAADEQALIYAAWAMLFYKRPRVRARWIYYAATNPANGNRKPAGLRPVETVFDARDPKFLLQISRLDEVVSEMCKIKLGKIGPLELPPRVESCQGFEGCPHRERCGLTDEDRLDGYFAKLERAKEKILT